MASENGGTEETTAAAEKRSFLPIALAAAGALLVGGLSGAFVAGPLLATRVAPAEAAAAESGGAEHAGGEAPAGEGGDHGGEGGEAAARPIHTLENLVLNPAGSGGTRFLMVTVALELRDAAAEETAKQRDPEVRDVVLRILGGKSVEQLADVAAREGLKAELRDSTGAVFSRGAVRRVYLPQFVIQ